MKGVMYAYCGLSSDLVNYSSLVSILQQMKISHFVPEHLSEPFEKCVMLVNEHQKMSRYPNFQIPPCAPAIVYTGAIATEVLMATKELFNKLMSDKKIAALLKEICELPIPKFKSMLQSLGGNNGKQ